MYVSIDAAWRNTIVNILDSPIVESRLGRTKEIVGYQVKLAKINQTFLLNPRRKLSPYYAAAEVLWYLQDTQFIEMISAYAPQYAKFAENGIAHGAYGYRLLYGINQFRAIVDILSKNMNSRQAVMSIWNRYDLIDNNYKDMPCTLSLQFLIRGSRLCLIVTMRSNDAWLGLPYDIFAFTSIQRLIANTLGIPTGWYIHQAGSEHLYEKDWAKAYEALSSINPKCLRLEHQWSDISSDFDWDCHVQEAVMIEKTLRQSPKEVTHQKITIPKDNILWDLLMCCAIKWKCTDESVIHSPILKEAMKHVNN